MPKKDNIKIFNNETYSKPLKENFETNKILYNHIVEIWSIQLADMIDYNFLYYKGFFCKFIIFDNF